MKDYLNEYVKKISVKPIVGTAEKPICNIEANFIEIRNSFFGKLRVLQNFDSYNILLLLKLLNSIHVL